MRHLNSEEAFIIEPLLYAQAVSDEPMLDNPHNNSSRMNGTLNIPDYPLPMLDTHVPTSNAPASQYFCADLFKKDTESRKGVASPTMRSTTYHLDSRQSAMGIDRYANVFTPRNDDFLANLPNSTRRDTQTRSSLVPSFDAIKTTSTGGKRNTRVGSTQNDKSDAIISTEVERL